MAKRGVIVKKIFIQEIVLLMNLSQAPGVVRPFVIQPFIIRLFVVRPFVVCPFFVWPFDGNPDVNWSFVVGPFVIRPFDGAPDVNRPLAFLSLDCVAGSLEEKKGLGCVCPAAAAAQRQLICWFSRLGKGSDDQLWDLDVSMPWVKVLQLERTLDFRASSFYCFKYGSQAS